MSAQEAPLVSRNNSATIPTRLGNNSCASTVTAENADAGMSSGGMPSETRELNGAVEQVSDVVRGETGECRKCRTAGDALKGRPAAQPTGPQFSETLVRNDGDLTGRRGCGRLAPLPSPPRGVRR